MAKAAAANHRAAHKPLARAALPIDTLDLARYLIGKLVVRETSDGVISGRIVETEAYPVADAAAHSFRGETPRNRTMFGARGHAYVYLAYGVSWMLNVSSEAVGVGAGVLIRALEPLEGIDLMQRNRGVEALRDLARGPGRLAQALHIDRSLDGVDLCKRGPLWLAAGPRSVIDVGVSTRIGLTKAADRPLRFYARNNRFVSGPKALNP
jgi:DNA-3-methyladenine glycosylase